MSLTKKKSTLGKPRNDILYRQIQGALTSTIVSHGPINKNFVPSATKRIIGQLNKYQNISYPDEPLKEALLQWLAREHKDLVRLRKKVQSVKDSGNKANFAGKASERKKMLQELNDLLKGFGVKNFIQNYNFHPQTKLNSEKSGDGQ